MRGVSQPRRLSSLACQSIFNKIFFMLAPPRGTLFSYSVHFYLNCILLQNKASRTYFFLHLAVHSSQLISYSLQRERAWHVDASFFIFLLSDVDKPTIWLETVFIYSHIFYLIFYPVILSF